MTRPEGRRIGLGAAGAVAAVLLAAGAQAEPRKGGSIVYANLSGAGTLDPQVAANVVELEAAHHIFEGLVEMSETYGVKPMLASSIDTSPDAKRFTFHLRHGVKFQNGKEMTSADVLASYQRYQKVSPNAAQLADVEAMEAPDPYTFVIALKNPNAVFLDVLKTPTYSFSILPAEQKDKPAREIDIIGTGPYQLDEWVKEDHLTLRRFEGYVPDTSSPGPDGLGGNKTAYLDTVRYNFVPEANARVAALQAGDVSYISEIPPELAKRLEGAANLAVQKVIPFCQQEFVLHTQNAPTTNALVRQAIAAVVDVDEIITASGQIADRNPSLVFKPSPYFPGEAAAQWYDLKDPAKAKALLQQAGYKGEKIVLEVELELHVHARCDPRACGGDEGGGHECRGQDGRLDDQQQRHGPRHGRVERQHDRVLLGAAAGPAAMAPAAGRLPASEGRDDHRRGVQEVLRVAVAGRPQGRVADDRKAHVGAGLHDQGRRPCAGARVQHEV